MLGIVGGGAHEGEQLASREPAVPGEVHEGVGRELYAMFRLGADSAERGASAMLAAGGL